MNRDNIKYWIDLGWKAIDSRNENGSFYDGKNEIKPCKRDINTGRFLKKEK